MHEKTASVADYFSAVYQCEDLGDVQVFPSSDELCRAFGARALTAGTSIHFRDGEFAPHTRGGFWLLAHEVAHVVQQRRGPVTAGAGTGAVGPPDAPEEAEACAAADAALAGRPFTFAAPAARTGNAGPVVQRYMAWEHLMLGTAGPDEARDLVREARGGAGDAALAGYREMLTALGRDPVTAPAASENPGDARFPGDARGGTPLVELPGSGLVLTLGEVSILPDYLSRPEDIERAPKDFLLPLVQSTREWCVRELDGMGAGPAARAGRGRRGSKRPALEPAMAYPRLGPIAEIAEAVQVTRLGRRCGFPPWECYQSVVARNAGHFAPFSWYRWQEYHLQARRHARQAHRAKSPSERARLATRAWVCAGYADHFLQDSFAAGHLINKTLVMQWYAELLTGSRLPVPERRHLAAVTAGAQPGLHGPGYYHPVADDRDPDRLVPSPTPGAPGVADPQAAAEAATLEGRVAASGVVGNDYSERISAYSSYLRLLRSSVVQSVSGTIHGYLNEKSLVVAAGADGERFRMYGDWSMLRGEAAAVRAAEAGQLSRLAIADLLETGETAVSSRKIFEMFPDHVEHDGALVPLQDWHSGRLRDWCHADFFRGGSARLMRAVTTIAFRHLGRPSADVLSPKRASGKEAVGVGQADDADNAAGEVRRDVDRRGVGVVAGAVGAGVGAQRGVEGAAHLGAGTGGPDQGRRGPRAGGQALPAQVGLDGFGGRGLVPGNEGDLDRHVFRRVGAGQPAGGGAGASGDRGVGRWAAGGGRRHGRRGDGRARESGGDDQRAVRDSHSTSPLERHLRAGCYSK